MMNINGVSRINPLNNYQNVKKTNATQEVKSSADEVEISEEAKAMSDAYFLNQVAKETPDVRADLVEQVKQKLQDPNYFSDANIAATADRILSAYGF